MIDTVKAPFKDELLKRIASVVNPAKIDIIVSSHVEPDHSSALPFVKEFARNAEVITSQPNGLKGLTARYGNLNYKPVKAGDSISIGERTLQFVPTPMLHWPDSMVTYCPEEKILFSNDAFGEHLATSMRFDDENDLNTVLFEAKKYYANILMPFGKQALAALVSLGGHDIKMIATGHGVIWRQNIETILDCYSEWAGGEVQDRAVVVFDSMWGSTQLLAQTITEAFAAKGIPAAYYDIKTTPMSDIVTDIFTSKYLAVGSPTINNQMMPTIAAFLCYLKGLRPQNHKGFAFGSYGWGGQSVGQVEDEMKAAHRNGSTINHKKLQSKTALEILIFRRFFYNYFLLLFCIQIGISSNPLLSSLIFGCTGACCCDCCGELPKLKPKLPNGELLETFD